MRRSTQLVVLCAWLAEVGGIEVDGLATHRSKLLSEYWVEGHQIFTSAFKVDRQGAVDDDDGGIGSDSDGLVLKGANWYGFESKACTYGGSWTDVPLAAHIDRLRRDGFNALRLPLALSGCHDNAMDELEELIIQAGDHGMLVLLVVETMVAGVPNDTGYIGGADGIERMQRGWERLAARFCDPLRFWNVMGADLMNSPHGMTWGDAPIFPPPPPLGPLSRPFPAGEPSMSASAEGEAAVR